MDITPSPRRLAAALAAAATLLSLAACGSVAPPPPESPAAAPHPLSATDVDTWLDGYLPAALEREGIPGASVAVVHDGEVLAERGFGWADRDERVPVEADETLFRIASVSKVVTATAVMQLVEAGAVDLDTDVEEYVDVVDLDRPATLRHLLTHTGGFEDRIRGLIGEPGTEVDLADALATDPPEQVYEPGTVPAYSNYGNALAGLVVEEVSGRPFEQYVADEVFEPASMDSSSFAQPLPGPLADRLAQGYPDATSPPVPFETVGTPPAGAMTTSATDMARFMLAHLGDGAELLRPATLAAMGAPALGEETLGGLAAAPRMTLGFFDRSRGGRRILEHSGDTDVFHADLALWPDDGTGIFVALNGSGEQPASSIALRDGLVEGFGDRYLPGDEPAPEAVDPEQAAQVAGQYESSRTIRSNFLAAAYAVGQTSVTAQEDGRLLITPGPDATESALYEPVGPWTWREVGGSRTIAARVVDGEVEAIGFDSAFTMLPVPAYRSAAVVVPLVGGSALVLVLAVLGGLVAAPVRWARRRDGRGQSSPDGRALRVLTRVGVVAAVLALVGWGVVVTGVMGLATPPTAVIRGVQLLQLVGLLGVVPAVLRAIDAVRRRAGAASVAAACLVALALLGVGWVAVSLRLLAPDISY